MTAENPAQHGEIVSVFATGGGRISPTVPTGTFGPTPPRRSPRCPRSLAWTTRGRRSLFQGYAPGFLGLYQYNFVIPVDARCGQRALNLKVGDSFSPNSTIPILCP